MAHNRTIRITIIFAILFVSFAHVPAHAGETRAGAAWVDITPVKITGVNLAGYSPRKSDGLHDPITARCAVIDDGSQQLALVAFDLIGVMYDDIAKMTADISAKTNIPADHIIIHSIHTHSGPDTMGIWGGSPKSYKARVAEGAAECVAKAAADMNPAGAFFVSGETKGFNINRRDPEKGKTDNTLAVMQFRGKDGKAIATVVNFACHPVVLGNDNLKITADYVYFLRKKLEDDRGGVAIFFSRDIGDMNPPAINKDVYERKGGTFEMAEKEGVAIAAESEKLLDGASEQPLRIRVAVKQFDLKVDNKQLLGLAKGGMLKRSVKNDAMKTAVAVVDLGPAQIATFPGEAFSGVREKADPLLPGPVKFFFSLTFDCAGYIVPQNEWNASRYEETVSTGLNTEPTLIEALSSLSDEMFRK